MQQIELDSGKVLFPKGRIFERLGIGGLIIVFLATGSFSIACEKLSPEDRRKALHLPPLGFKGDAQKGLTIYQTNCVACHGPSGSGSVQGPPLVHQVYRTNRHANLSFHFAVRQGVKSHHWNYGDMKPVSEITSEETEHVVAYIRREQRRKGIE